MHLWYIMNLQFITVIFVKFFLTDHEYNQNSVMIPCPQMILFCTVKNGRLTA